MNTAARQPNRLRYACWAFVIVIALSSAIELAIFGNGMAPIQRGDPCYFWQVASGVDPYNSEGAIYASAGDAYVVDDTWAVYHHYNFGSTFEISYVPYDEVCALFPTVVENFARHLDEHTLLNGPELKGFVQWQSAQIADRSAKSLVDMIKWAREQSHADDGAAVVNLAKIRELQFWDRWRRGCRYWVNYVFEFLFFTGLALFVVWPGLRPSTPLRWAMHVAALPFLLMLPAYLGYATVTFTSLEPCGGIIYPNLIAIFRSHTFNSFDQWLLTHFPQILEPISSTVGPPLSMRSDENIAAPTQVLLRGMVLGFLVWCIAFLIRERSSTTRKAAPAESPKAAE